jgi:hypothetical protein
LLLAAGHLRGTMMPSCGETHGLEHATGAGRRLSLSVEHQGEPDVLLRGQGGQEVEELQNET